MLSRLGQRWHAAEVGQAPGLDLPRVRLVLEALRQMFQALPTLAGYVDPGYRLDLVITPQPAHPLFGPPALDSLLRVVDESGQELSQLWEAEFPAESDLMVYGRREVPPSLDDVVLTTLAQAQQAIERANEDLARGGWEELPDFFDVADQVGPGSLAGALELLLLGVSL